MGRHVWDEATKEAALALLADPEQSYYDVHKATGVPASTLHDWASAAGLTGHSERLQETEAARQFRTERIAVKRAVVAEKFLDAVETFLAKSEDLAGGMVELKKNVYVSGGRDALALMQSAQLAMNAHRLEMGEATSRVESRDLDAAAKARSKVDDLAERRSKKTA